MNIPIKKAFFVFVIFVSFFVFADNVSGQRFYLGPQLGSSAQKPSLLDIEFSTDTTFLYGFRAGVKIYKGGITGAVPGFTVVSAEICIQQLMTYSSG